MNYIAISNNEFVMIDENTNETDLLNRGFVLYTLEQYNTYISNNGLMSEQDTLSYLEDKAIGYISFGCDLWDKIKRKVWALNTLNLSKGIVISVNDMKTLLATSDLLEKSLKTGSLNTAISVCYSLKSNLPIYASIADFAVAEITNYMNG